MPKKKKKNIFDILSNHANFLVIIVLISGFSLYAIISYVNSTNDYIYNLKASVMDSTEVNTMDVAYIEETSPDEAVVELEETEPVQYFTDVDDNHVNAEAISTLYFQGILNGYDDGSFKPDNTINRAELLTLVTNAIDADFSGQVLENCFTDVNTQWFAAFVCYAKNAGWVNGYEDNSYRPNNPVAKAEAIKIVFEAFNYPLCEGEDMQSYDDVVSDAWYAAYACAARRDDIIARAGLFNANESMTRGHFAQLLFNVLDARDLL